MSGLYYNNPYANPYAAANLQYGVNMPAPSYPGAPVGAAGAAAGASVANGFAAASGLASMIPYAGPFVSAALNFAGTWYQNYKQEQFYNEYMSPQARMAQMKAAGINPNAAAQGISGAPAPSMSAAPMSNAGNGVGEQLGNSVNTALTADAIKAGIRNTDAETDLTNSLNTEKTITNSYLDRMQMATLDKLVADGDISKSFAAMAAVDEAYKPQVAAANYQQLVANLNKTAAEIENLNANTILEFAQVYQAMANASLAEAQIHKVFSDIGLNNAMINKIAHEVTNIDAQTAATYQGIDESKARTAALEIQNKFQQDYYDIWKVTGFNWNSDIEKSIIGAYQNFQTEDAMRMQRYVEIYAKNVGDSKYGNVNYTYDKLWGILGVAGQVVGKTK